VIHRRFLFANEMNSCGIREIPFGDEISKGYASVDEMRFAHDE